MTRDHRRKKAVRAHASATGRTYLDAAARRDSCPAGTATSSPPATRASVLQPCRGRRQRQPALDGVRLRTVWHPGWPVQRMASVRRQWWRLAAGPVGGCEGVRQPGPAVAVSRVAVVRARRRIRSGHQSCAVCHAPSRAPAIRSGPGPVAPGPGPDSAAGAVTCYASTPDQGTNTVGARLARVLCVATNGFRCRRGAWLRYPAA